MTMKWKTLKSAEQIKPGCRIRKIRDVNDTTVVNKIRFDLKELGPVVELTDGSSNAVQLQSQLQAGIKPASPGRFVGMD